MRWLPHEEHAKIERSYLRGKKGCFRLMVVLHFGGVVALMAYACNRPAVRTIDVMVPLPQEHKYVEPPPRKVPLKYNRKYD